MDDENLFIIPGMPFKDFPEAPEDHPGSKLTKCKYCDEKMWISEKKRLLIIEKPDAFIACWLCLLDMAKNGEMKAEKIIRINI